MGSVLVGLGGAAAMTPSRESIWNGMHRMKRTPDGSGALLLVFPRRPALLRRCWYSGWSRQVPRRLNRPERSVVWPICLKPRFLHTATALTDGRVLIAGGASSVYAGPTVVEVSAELFLPGSGTFIGTSSMKAPRWGHTATLLSDGESADRGRQYRRGRCQRGTLRSVDGTFLRHRKHEIAARGSSGRAARGRKRVDRRWSFFR